MKELDLAADMFRQLQETLDYLARWSAHVSKNISLHDFLTTICGRTT